MNINYQLKLEDIIRKEKDNKNVATLLLHSCCAPCSSYVLTYLSDYFKITILYYNPNIYPMDEYLKRLNEQKRLIKEMKTKNKIDIMECNWENEEFNKIARGLENEPEKGIRCHKCYKLRLEKTARYAMEYNYDYFGTTLSVSPYKNSSVLNDIGKEISEKYNLPYLYSDFKKKEGYKKSIELSKLYNLYRQNYCGCIYSKNKNLDE